MFALVCPSLKGLVPTTNSDGSAYMSKSLDMQPGKRLDHTYCFLWLEADWAEHCHTLGLQMWSTSWAPCQFCRCTKDLRQALLNLVFIGSG